MPDRNIENLPLLESLAAVLDAGSVGGAAVALGVTQSAVSKHLTRLRAWLDDPLFVRTTSGMEPTPRALAAREQLDVILGAARALESPRPPTPAGFTGELRIVATDEVLGRLVPTLLERIEREAPGLRLTTLPLTPSYSMASLETGAVSLVVAVNWHAPEALKQRHLFADEFACLMHADHPLARGRLTAKRYAAAHHVLAAPLGRSRGLIDRQLADRGLARKIVASVPEFSLVTRELIGKTRVATLPRRVAEERARRVDLVIRRLPFETPRIDYFVFWHPRFDREPRITWARRAIQELVGD